MSETLTAPDPSVHQHGLVDTGPAASADTAGRPTEIRGLGDDVSGLQESVPDGKALQELSESSEEVAQEVQQELGGLAMLGSEVEVPEAAEIEDGFETNPPEASASIDQEATQQPIDQDEAKAEPETEAPTGSNKAKETQEAGENPYTDLSKEELKEKLRELNKLWDEQIKTPYKKGEEVDQALWDKFDEEHWLVVYALWDQGLDESKVQNEIEYEDMQAQSEAARQSAEPEFANQTASSQTSPSNQTAPKPNNSNSQTTSSNPGANNNSNNANSNSNSSNTTQPQTQTTPNPTPPSPKPSQKSQQPANPTVQAAQAAAAQAGQGGFGGAEAAAIQSNAHKETGTTPVSTADVGLGLETGEEVGFVDTLSPEDQTIWGNIVRINEQFKDGEVSEALAGLEKNFNEENAAIVMSRAQKSAQARQGRGDAFGARQQQMLAANLDQLAGHIFGRSITNAA